MALLTPLALALGALAAPIVLMYMLRLRRRETIVSSTLLWQQILRDREANTPWQKLRRNILLLLQLLILAALVFALARPYTEVPTISAGRIALLIDASASMNATDVQPSRFESARQQALNIVDTLGEKNTLSVIRVSAGPEVLAPYTNDQAVLRAAIQSAKPGSASADWSAALTLAAAGFAGAEKFSVVIIGDGGLPPNLPAVPGDVKYIPVGKSDANVAISALAAASSPGAGPQIYARLTNYGAQAANTVLSIKLDDTLFNAQKYTVPANGSVDVVVPNLPNAFRRVEADLTRPTDSTTPDYLPLDDTAWTVYNPASAGRVLLMTAQNRFLEQGFSSLPDWQTFRGQMDKGLPDQRYDLYVFDGYLPSKLPDANMLIINPPAGSVTPLFSVTGKSSAPIRGASVVGDDSRVAAVRFDNVNVREFKTLSGTGWTSELVTSASGPLLLAGEQNGHRVAILTFDLHDSDLPLQIAWPILLADLSAWYKTPRAINAPNGLQPGNTLAILPALDADLVRVHKPDGSTTTLKPTQGSLFYADTEQPGIYGVDVYKGSDLIQQEAFAVNLFDPLESRIAPTSTLQIGSLSAQAAQTRETGQREYWPWVALIALLILTLEWYVYYRGSQMPNRPRPRTLGTLLSRR